MLNELINLGVLQWIGVSVVEDGVGSVVGIVSLDLGNEVLELVCEDWAVEDGAHVVLQSPRLISIGTHESFLLLKCTPELLKFHFFYFEKKLIINIHQNWHFYSKKLKILGKK